MIYFAWDETKAASNLRKHGVRFEVATEVFDDPFALSEMDQIIDGEERWKVIGMGGDDAILVAVYTITVVGEEEYVRIISARKAERKELRRYERKNLH